MYSDHSYSKKIEYINSKYRNCDNRLLDNRLFCLYLLSYLYSIMYQNFHFHQVYLSVEINMKYDSNMQQKYLIKNQM